MSQLKTQFTLYYQEPNSKGVNMVNFILNNLSNHHCEITKWKKVKKININMVNGSEVTILSSKKSNDRLCMDFLSLKKHEALEMETYFH